MCFMKLFFNTFFDESSSELLAVLKLMSRKSRLRNCEDVRGTLSYSPLSVDNEPFQKVASCELESVSMLSDRAMFRKWKGSINGKNRIYCCTASLSTLGNTVFVALLANAKAMLRMSSREHGTHGE
uniref:Uncharacterized protein n=1 Tax=Glossina austeni TaxID=7395 RepID=A0A1A9VFJ9_GLOAU